MCARCETKRVDPPVIDKAKQHTWTHQLVRCKPKHQPEVVAEQEDRMAVLEKQVSQLREHLAKVESALGSVLSKLEVGDTKSST